MLEWGGKKGDVKSMNIEEKLVSSISEIVKEKYEIDPDEGIAAIFLPSSSQACFDNTVMVLSLPFVA